MAKRLSSNKDVTFNNIVPNRICAHCGKEFCIPVWANFDDYAYKKPSGRRGGEMLYYCSYGHFRAAGGGNRIDRRRKEMIDPRKIAELNERKKKQLAVILPLYQSGMTLMDVANEIGMSHSTVRTRLQEVGALR